MSEPFENKVEVHVGTQKILVDQSGHVTVVNAGPPGPSGPNDHGGLNGLEDDDHPQYHNNARGDARYSAINHTHPVSAIDGAQADLRTTSQEYLRDEWEKRTAPIMVTNPTAELMDGTYDATWEITRATSRGTLPHTPNGVDIQWFGKVLRPYTQAELDAAGVGGLTAGDPPDSMYQAFYELMTLVRPSITNDWFEWARFMSNLVSPGKGRASYFWEGTIIGGLSEHSNNAVADSGQEVGQPERNRITVSTATATLTLWNWVPYYNGDPSLNQCPRGLWWKPYFSQTHPAWASMANPETETVPPDPAGGFVEGQPEVIQPWRVGIQARLEIGELFFYHFGETTPLLHIDDTVLENAGVGVTSFVDGTGVTTVSTVTAYTAPGPGVQASTVNPLLLLPTPVGEPDGKIVKVVNELWVPGDLEKPFPVFEATFSGGEVYSQPGPFGTFSTYVSTLAEAAFTAVYLPAGTYDQIFINCTVAGNVTLRLCLDSVGPNGLPETLLKDAGTISTAGSAGFKIASMTWVNPISRWVWCRVQTEAVVSATTVTTLNGQAGNQWPPWPSFPSSTNAGRGQCGGRVLAHALGPDTQPLDAAAPATFILNSPGSPRVWVRRAA